MTAATTTSLGEIKLAGDIGGVNNANAPELTNTGITPGVYTLPTVTFDAKGRALSASNGTTSALLALLPAATTTTLGIVSVPASGGLTVNGSGALSVPNATSSVKGIASFSSDFTVAAGSVSINTAGLTAATAISLGAVKIGNNITNSSGTISIPDATSSVKGVAKFNTSDFTVTGGSVALNQSSFPVATSTTTGTVIVGGNITLTGSTISVPDATTTVKGVASFNGTDFTVTAGAVSVNTTTVASSLPLATSTTLGVVKAGGAGTNITNTSGVLSITDATTSTKGVASFNSSDFTVTSGVVSLTNTVARTSTQNTWSKAQSYAVSSLAYGATITPDFSLSNVFSLTPTGNFTLANPTNVVAGTTYLLIITQDSTGGRLITWGSNFKFADGTTTLSTAPGKRDIISIVAVTSTVLLVTIQKGF